MKYTPLSLMLPLLALSQAHSATNWYLGGDGTNLTTDIAGGSIRSIQQHAAEKNDRAPSLMASGVACMIQGKYCWRTVSMATSTIVLEGASSRPQRLTFATLEENSSPFFSRHAAITAECFRFCLIEAAAFRPKSTGCLCEARPLTARAKIPGWH